MEGLVFTCAMMSLPPLLTHRLELLHSLHSLWDAFAEKSSKGGLIFLDLGGTMRGTTNAMKVIERLIMMAFNKT